MKMLASGVMVLRVFMERDDQSHGWISILLNHRNCDEAQQASPLLANLLLSPAIKSGRVLNLAAECPATEKLKLQPGSLTQGHNALPGQRPFAFYTSFAEQFNLFGQHKVGNCCAANIVIAEEDAGAGSVPRWLQNLGMIPGSGTGPTTRACQVSSGFVRARQGSSGFVGPVQVRQGSSETVRACQGLSGLRGLVRARQVQ